MIILILMLLISPSSFENIRGEEQILENSKPVIVFGHLSCNTCYSELGDYFDKNGIDYTIYLNAGNDILSRKQKIQYAKSLCKSKDYVFSKSESTMDELFIQANVEIFPCIFKVKNDNLEVIPYEMLFKDKELNAAYLDSIFIRNK